MDENDFVHRLVEMLSAFFTEEIAVEEDLTYLLTSEFLQNIQDVLFTKLIVSYSRFQDYFNDKSQEMLSSPEKYLKTVFYACLQDGLVSLKAFENFLNVFAIILRISIETRLRKGVDFCKLVPDMFIKFYYEELNPSFLRCYGFRLLVEYVNNPKYLKSKCIGRNISSFYNPSVFINGIPKDLSEKAQKMIRKEQQFKTCLKPEKFDKTCSLLAKRVLKYAQPEFIPILNDNDLNPRKKILEISGRGSKETSECCSSLSSNSKTNDSAVVKMTDEWYENIVEAVIRYNNSKNCHGKSKGRIQKEADQNLEQLKCSIQSLIQVLDECDKE